MSLTAMAKSWIDVGLKSLAPREAAAKVVEHEGVSQKTVIDVADHWAAIEISTSTRYAADLAQQASIDAYKQNGIFSAHLAGAWGPNVGKAEIERLVTGEREALRGILRTVLCEGNPRAQAMADIASDTLKAMDGGGDRPAREGSAAPFGTFADAGAFHDAAMSAFKRIGKLGGVDVEAGLMPLRVQHAQRTRATFSALFERKAAG